MDSFEKITMKVIPSEKQRYPTCGDYWIKGSNVNFRVSDLKDMGMELLVLIHELVEWTLVNRRGISIDSIDDFDIQFEKDRVAGKHTDDEEPGDDKKAPYFKEHQIATKVEKLMAKELGIDWDKYNKAVMES
jgi:hypothetical protein